ncbi:hypothetical protein EIK77_007476 [Talaromyces pinophilus]|nr:hypothetical protein EIK77_007476 [Talaromyces pinophilus]
MAFKNKNQTILSSKRDWERWLRPIKSKALGTEVWEYINPDLILPANGAATPSEEESADNTKKYEKRLIKLEVPSQREGESDTSLTLRYELYKQAQDEYKTNHANIAAI